MKLNTIQQMMLDTGMLDIKPIPEYDGEACQSFCGKQTECYHAEMFDESRGIVRSGLDFDIKSDKETTHFKAELI